MNWSTFSKELEISVVINYWCRNAQLFPRWNLELDQESDKFTNVLEFIRNEPFTEAITRKPNLFGTHKVSMQILLKYLDFVISFRADLLHASVWRDQIESVWIQQK